MLQTAPDLRTVSPEEFTVLGGRRAVDELTRRILARNAHTVVIQASLPPETDVPPHGLPAGKFAMLTLLRGQLALALGPEFDPTYLKQLAPGDMALFRPGDPYHFGRTGADGAEILVVAFEPAAATELFVNLLENAG